MGTLLCRIATYPSGALRRAGGTGGHTIDIAASGARRGRRGAIYAEDRDGSLSSRPLHDKRLPLVVLEFSQVSALVCIFTEPELARPWVKKIKVKVVGCLGKCDAGNQCPHVLPDYLDDSGIPKEYPYPHFSIISVPVEVDVAAFKEVISAAAHKGGSTKTNWWKPDFTHTKFHPTTPSIELRDRNDSGPSTTLKKLCDAIKKYTPPSGLPKITSCDGMETSAGTHITVPHTWVSSSGLGKSHQKYLHGDTSGLTWWVTILYSEPDMNCFEKYPYHLVSSAT